MINHPAEPAVINGEIYDRTHGGAFDRGSADSYYGRMRNPHYGGVGGSIMPYTDRLTAEEAAEYMAGYDYNEQYGDKKDWG